MTDISGSDANKAGTLGSTERTIHTARTIGELATAIYAAFEPDTRQDGSQFWKVSDAFQRQFASFYDSWVTTMFRKAHDGMLPDDAKYEFIMDALGIISENWDADDRTDADDMIEYVQPDIYNNALLRWVASSLERMGYVDEAVSDFGWPFESGLAGALIMGQRMEREEAFRAVYKALEEEAGDRENYDDVEAAILALPREAVAGLLEANSIQVTDDEDISTLREALWQRFLDGNIDGDDIEAAVE